MNFEELIPDYLAGKLDDKTLHKFEKFLTENPELKEETDKFKLIWDKLGYLAEENPSEELDTGFYAMLNKQMSKHANQKNKVKFSEKLNGLISSFWPRKPVIQFVFSAAFLLIGLLLGGKTDMFKSQSSIELAQMRSEVQKLNQLVTLSLLEQSSPADRLKGTLFANQLNEPDDRVINALFRTLEEDPNDNVRLASVDALSSYTGKRNIRQRLIGSLQKQESPLVTVQMINLFIDIDEKQAARIFKELLAKNNLNIILKDELKRGIENLEYKGNK
ncbi:hypothetical protein ACFL4T_13760 [candidate division KSB1 bacterium]